MPTGSIRDGVPHREERKQKCEISFVAISVAWQGGGAQGRKGQMKSSFVTLTRKRNRRKGEEINFWSLSGE